MANNQKQMKTFFLTLSLLLIHFSIYAQSITGKVVNEYGQAVQYTDIYNQKTNQHTHSNQLGEFTLNNCSPGDTLHISCIGYLSIPVEIESLEAPITIILSETSIDLAAITVRPQINALSIFSDIDLQTSPVNSSQDILQKVPGLFIGQHAGGGKAEQIFLRGFDIDHGTDINITVDGLPVNMVSHAHGHGYSDLHFVIPETVEKIEFGKGPYHENKGNFATAGYVGFNTKKRLESSTFKLDKGQFDSYRLMAMLNILEGSKHNAYVATEFISKDGFFESPQNFNRTNLFGKYYGQLNNNDLIEVTASRFQSHWDASGQIPERAVKSGLISRFGAIDNTEGGSTSRSNLLLGYTRPINESSMIKSKLFLSQYNFELYSNFTFFLEDTIHGDQIRQKEHRMIYGFSTEYDQAFSNEVIKGNWQAGFSLRNDRSDNNELSHTANRREILTHLRLGDINETNLGAYLASTIVVNKWTFNPSIRLDYFDYQYHDKLISAYQSQDETKAIASPKLNILYNPSNNLQLYLKTGKGFHSNDTRVVLAREGEKILPAAYGFDIGYIWKPTSKMFVNMAYWHLYLEQEFVYVGDAGIVEPSGATKRQGVDLSYRYQPFSWLYLNVDANYTQAKTIDAGEGGAYIPLAPGFTWTNGLSVLLKSGFYGSIDLRDLANRPANEDNSIVAEGYTITDLNAGFNMKTMSFGIQIQNLFNAEWKETQFATESRLPNETESVEEIHFTPGTPFFLKGTIQYRF